MQPTLLILAAGIGSRYGGLKQVDPVGPNGETIIDYSIYDAIRAGFGKVVFIIRHDIEQAFKEAVSSRFTGRIPIEYAYQELDKIPRGSTVPPGRTKPWGTGHAILMAESLIHEPFSMINADDFYGADSFKTLCDHLKATHVETNDYSMIGFTLRNTLSAHGAVARGVCRVDPQGLLQQVVELLKIEKAGNGARYTDSHGATHSLAGDEIVSMNMWGFTPTLFGHLRELFTKFLEKHGHEQKSEFLIPTVVNTLVYEKKVTLKVLPTKSTWFGVTYKEDRPAVIESIRQLIRRGEYPEKLWS
jgi:UTP-glucose-1-phosphate uridylyltransferase